MGDAAFNAWAEESVGDVYVRLNLVDDVTAFVPPIASVAPVLQEQGYINRWVSGIVGSLGYAPTAGFQYSLTADGQRFLTDSVEHAEFEYWQQFFTALRAGPITVTVPAMIKSFPQNHKPQRYLCAMAGWMAEGGSSTSP